MGQMKDILAKIDAGYANPLVTKGRKVCPGCFTDRAIQHWIAQNADGQTCDFCHTSYPSAVCADLEGVADHIVGCLGLEWDDPNGCLHWDSEDDQWFGSTYDITDVLEQTGATVSATSGDLWDVLIDCLGSDRVFCERNPYGLPPHLRLMSGWQAMGERIKHERRFFFLQKDAAGWDPDYLDPGEVLEWIADDIASLGLSTTVKQGQRLFRVRWQQPGKTYTTPTDLGPPPQAQATKSNRMSPPGIVMTYLALDANTALAETQDGPGTYACGCFEALADLHLIDLSSIPPVPSLFDANRNGYRSSLLFLREFANDLSKPIAHDDRVHVEYIPTQVVTEYLREHFSSKHFPVHGLRYMSAARPGYASVVLFCDARYVEGTSPWLKLHSRSEMVV